MALPSSKYMRYDELSLISKYAKTYGFAILPNICEPMNIPLEPGTFTLIMVQQEGKDKV